MAPLKPPVMKPLMFATVSLSVLGVSVVGVTVLKLVNFDRIVSGKLRGATVLHPIRQRSAILCSPPGVHVLHAIRVVDELAIR